MVKVESAFLELVRAGLWEKEARLSQFGNVDYAAILQLAEEQSVVGLVTAGLDCVKDVKVPQEWMLQFIGSTLQIEQQNKEMNAFVAKLIEKLRKEDVYAILVKGQGIAQCYEKPLWRCSGDVDLLLDEKNYNKASAYLSPKADQLKENRMDIKHFEMTFGNWVVELHGTLHGEWSNRVDGIIDEIQDDTFKNKNYRIWNNNGIEVLLPSPDTDVLFVFSHILQHFFWEGVGLRQVCDWSRLLWCYRRKLDIRLLEERIRRMGLMSEWKVFASLAVNYLGMPVEAMPLYSESDNQNEKYWRKAESLLFFIMMSGNFGHNRDNSYKDKSSFIIRLAISFWLHIKATYKRFRIFPVDSIKAARRMLRQGITFAFKKYVI